MISSNELVNQEVLSEDCEDYVIKICFSTTYCIMQMINVIEQIIQYYPTDNLVITLDSGNNISGRPGSLFPSTNTGLFLIVDSTGKVQEAVSICKIVSIAITSAAYNDNITYNPAPEQPPTGCDANCESAIREYTPVGSEVQIKAGGQTVADGIVNINVYTMLVVVDKNNNNPVFVSSCKVESIK